MNDRQARILIVDDEPDALFILRHVLTKAGYDVIPAYGGADALRKVQRQNFDLIVTDLAMPDVSGIEVIDRVRNDPEKHLIPILAVTAYLWDNMSQCASQSGCDAFLNKPVNAKDLVREVDRQLRTRRSPHTALA
jgi:two-component system cell cycle response regulator DivK